MYPFVEEEHDEDEDPEGDDLDEETSQDDVLTKCSVTAGQNSSSFTQDVSTSGGRRIS